jgi:hypothetical protein
MSDSSPFKDIAEESLKESVQEDQPQESLENERSTDDQKPENIQEEESFTEKEDLKGKTPEELEEIRKKWDSAYRAKRQKETQEIKDYQKRLQDLEERLAQKERPTSGIQQSAQYAQHQVELGNMSVPEYTRYIENLMAEKARMVAREEYQVLNLQEREQYLAASAVEKFQSSDPRLSEHSPEYDESFKVEVQREMADLLDKHLSEHNTYEGFDAESLTKEIVNRRDKQIDDIIKKRTQQSTHAARMRESKLRKSSTHGTTSDAQNISGNSFRDILSDTIDGAS